MELNAKHWKKMHDIEFINRMDTIKELAKRERRIEELEKQLEEQQNEE